MMQTITVHGQSGEHFTVTITRQGDALTLQTADEAATVADEARAADWLQTRVDALIGRVGRIVIREKAPVLTIKAFQRYGVPIYWQE